MKVAILYNTSWYVFLLRRNLIRDLVARGVEVTVISPTDAYTDRVKQLGVQHIPISMRARSTNPLSELQTVWEISAALRRCAPDFVFSYTIKCNLYAGLARFAGARFRQVANISGLGEGFDREGLLNRVVKALYRVSLCSAHRIFFQNQEDLDLCLKHSLVPEAVCERIPGSGVDLSFFSPGKARKNGEIESTQKPIFLMFGRLLPKKGFYAFLEAAKAIRAHHGETARFWVLGSPDLNRPDSVALHAALRMADQDGIIELLPPTDDVLPLLRQARAVVLPSTYNEGVPRSLLEALACGKPIITTDWKGCRETVIDGDNGYLVPPLDQEALELAIDRILTAHPDEIDRMEVASRALAQSRFDERLVVERYLACLELPDEVGGQPVLQDEHLSHAV